ncbi:hypothetical protein [Streptomyces mayonensis]|uniref:hypothetical protein n=1 Tax=Streptomyces mayonensis TaxID=2750816 RepID=UPI001C1E2A6C|nr:hypothetical protein [Streptomyces sp. A108]MBU6529654.1 hypothetical protein [Streptomyces sp. A108]
MSTTAHTAQTAQGDPRPLRLSLRVWGCYMMTVGALLFLVPNQLIGLFGFPDIEDNWIRVFGALILNLGLVYFPMARDLPAAFVRWCIYSRYLFFCFATVIVIADWLPAGLLVFGAWDALNATWAWYGYRKASL